ncbi:hypothetical protein GCM10023322_11860 [Rugosimonospora acidiphila]|uniref:ATP-grasp target RiPP n=1 Tax=Rugosimonospora acidiphila TaxID=556531 RepID=A0ABP9RNH0_9ACTN
MPLAVRPADRLTHPDEYGVRRSPALGSVGYDVPKNEVGKDLGARKYAGQHEQQPHRVRTPAEVFSEAAADATNDEMFTGADQSGPGRNT